MKTLGASPVLVFRVLLAGIIASTGVGVWYALTQRAAFQAGFPGAATASVYWGLVIVGGVGVVVLVGLWLWQRWAVASYALVVIASLVLDVVAEAPALHQATVVLGAAAVFSLVYVNRRRFRRTRAGESA